MVLADGLQRIGEVAADLIRYTDSHVGEQIPTVSSGVVGALPVVDTLPVTTFPEHGGVTDDPVVCARWRADPAGDGSHTGVLVGQAVPTAGRSVALAQADADGPAVDAVSLPAGRSAFVCSVGLTGGGQSTGSLFLVTDSGVLFGVRDADAARSLGLTDPRSTVRRGRCWRRCHEDPNSAGATRQSPGTASSRRRSRPTDAEITMIPVSAPTDHGALDRGPPRRVARPPGPGRTR